MPRYVATAPDGKRYQITAPDGAGEKEVLAFLQEKVGGDGPRAPKAPATAPYEGWGQYGKDLLRTAGQGASLGFGDEIVAGIRSLGGTPYSQALSEERAALDRFREQNPGTALTAELAGGFALPGAGAARLVNRGAGFLAKTARSAGVGAGYGAAGGFASGEGGAANRLERAQEGVKVGSAIGAAIPGAQRLLAPVFRGAQNAATRITDNEESARLYLADRLRRQGHDEQQIASLLNSGEQARQFAKNKAVELPQTIADMTPATQRILRGIKVGGDADDIIEPFLAQRQAGVTDLSRGGQASGQIARMGEQLRRSMNVSDEELPVALERLTGDRKAKADAMFATARNASQPFDLSNVLAGNRLRAMSEPDPATRNRLMAATDMFTQSGKYGNYGNPQFPVNDIERFHKAKVALDNMIDQARGNDRRVLTRFKHELMDEVTSGGKNQPYREALNTYRSQSELIDAADIGRALYRKGLMEVPASKWAALSEPEKRMARRAWVDAFMEDAGRKTQGPTADFTGKLRTRNREAQLRLILPPRAGSTGAAGQAGGNRAKLEELLRTETSMSMTAAKVLGNSSTAEKAIDAIDVGAMVRSLRYIKDQGGLINAAVNAVADQLEKLAAIKGERARYLAEQLLSTDPQQQARFLGQVAMTYGRSRATKLKQIADVLGEAWSGNAASYAGRQQETRH